MQTFPNLDLESSHIISNNKSIKDPFKNSGYKTKNQKIQNENINPNIPIMNVHHPITKKNSNQYIGDRLIPNRVSNDQKFEFQQHKFFSNDRNDLGKFLQDGLSNDVLMNSNANQMSNNDYNADNDFNNELNLWNTIAHQSLLLDNITGLGYGTQGNAFLNENQHNLLRNRILPFNMNHALCQNNNSKSLLDNLKSFDSKDTFVFPEKKIRVLPKIPDKVLDAPDLSGDFYYNLIDWSQKNVLSVVLDSSVYLWNAETGQNYILTESEERICSINWMNSGTCLAIGLESGAVQLWDTIKNELLRTMHGHTDRVSALSWNDYIISSGSRDSKIFNHDVRVQSHIVSTYLGHKYEVCGLKWSPDGEQLASGGGDNKICIWDVNKSSNINPLLYEIDHDFGINNAEAGNVFNTFENNNNTSSSVNDFIRANSNDSGSGQRNNYLSTHIARLKELAILHPKNTINVKPFHKLNKHKATVKALAWCPFQRRILASGGGSNDPSIKIWNTDTGNLNHSLNTESQICSLAWNRFDKELVSTHGLPKFQVSLWNYPTMKHIGDLNGHTSKVLHMALSPDGTTIVTGAGGRDQTLRFWKIFENKHKESSKPNIYDYNYYNGSKNLGTSLTLQNSFR